MTDVVLDLEGSLRWLASHRGLVRFLDEPGEMPLAWVMIPVRSSEERIISRLPIHDGDDPVTVAVTAVEEVRAELAARDGRRLLRLA